MTQYFGLEKIADLNSGGMLSAIDSVAYHAHVTRRAVNYYERWYGLSPSLNGEIKRADRIGVSSTPFQIDGGNSTVTPTWGDWVQILGSSDTPADAGMVYYNLHKLMIIAVESAATYFVQLAFGTSGAAGLTALTYTEMVFKPASTSADETPYVVRARRQIAGTKAWARCIALTKNTGTMDFFIGLIGYEG